MSNFSILIALFVVGWSVDQIAAAPSQNNPFRATLSEKYEVSKSTGSFIQAYITCKRYGFQLVKELSADDTTALNEVITEAGLTTNLFYIGAVARASDFYPDDWVWFEDLQTLTYTTFEVGTLADQECLARSSVKTDNGAMVTTPCSTKLHFVCQTIE